MSTGTPLLVGSRQYFDDNGDPLDGGFLYTFLSGTATPTPVYKDATLSTQFTNPIELDSAGRVATMYVPAESLKTYLTDANGVPVGPNGGYDDPLPSIELSASNIGGVVFDFGGEQEVPIVATAYPSGATYDKCHPDTGWWSIDSATLVGTYALQAMMLGVSAVTVSCALVNLTDSSPDTPVIAITSAATLGDRVISTPITFAAAGAPKVYGIKCKVSSGYGYVWQVQLIRIT